jgi:hypothetical protein
MNTHFMNPPLEAIKRIVLEGLEGHKARLYLFGSWATGNRRRGSDVDVAILPLEPLPTGLLSEIRENLEESSIPYFVDLVDLSQVEPAFRERVEREGIAWNA